MPLLLGERTGSGTWTRGGGAGEVILDRDSRSSTTGSAIDVFRLEALSLTFGGSEDVASASLPDELSPSLSSRSSSYRLS